MFYLSYLKSELLRRFTRTISIVLGLAIASSIIVVIISTSNSLSNAQSDILNPLQNVGTDILVTRSVNTEQMNLLDATTRDEVRSANSTIMDLSKLGKAGESFSYESFMLGSMLSFDATQSAKLDSSLVSNYVGGLIMTVTHQEGKIPTITAEFQTGGQRIQFNQDIPQMTDAEREAVENARTKAMADLQAKGIDPRSNEGRKLLREAENAVMPERLKKITAEITVPKEVIRQQLDTPQTDLKTESYTIAGVDATKKDIGLILPSQITTGKYFEATSEAVVNVTYAQKKGLNIGDKLTLNKNDFTIVGFVDPKLYTNTADVYLPLTALQQLANKAGKINILLIKSINANNVEEISNNLTSLLPGIKVTNSADTAKQVTGTLVDASSLTNKFIGLVSAVVIIASFIIVSLLAVTSVHKRIREIGTLKAIGWDNIVIVRQLLLENITLGVIGGVVGIVIAYGIIAILNHYNISLSASVASMNATQSMFKVFGPLGGRAAASDNITNAVNTSVSLHITFTYLVLTIGAGISILGAIIAGTLASLKATRMRPQDALRSLE